MIATICTSLVYPASNITDAIIYAALVSLSLRTGAPLPHITPSPLLDRFMLKYHGLNVSHKEKDTEHALPVPLSLETLKNEQYL